MIQLPELTLDLVPAFVEWKVTVVLGGLWDGLHCQGRSLVFFETKKLGPFDLKRFFSLPLEKWTHTSKRFLIHVE